MKEAKEEKEKTDREREGGRRGIGTEEGRRKEASEQALPCGYEKGPWHSHGREAWPGYDPTLSF